MGFYIKKPIMVEAIQYTGDNEEEILEFMNHKGYFKDENKKQTLIIPTLEGDMRANIGSWIVKGAIGEYYPVREDIFYDTFDKAYL